MSRYSVDSPGTHYEGKDNVGASKKKLNRSLTISGSGGFSGAQFHAKHSNEPSSPLERFSKAKEAISHIFDILRERLTDSQEFVDHVYKGEESGSSKQIASLTKCTDEITEILQRDHMKVVFFGRTSNGKSTVVNCLLRERVLPSGIGHTTNCFCSVMGVDESEGYLLHPTSQQKQNVKNVRQLAHSLHKEHLDPSSLVKIFWPKTKCPLLSGEVELVDSPGVDMSPDLDDWINKYCMNADVFVLVLNAESSLMTTEKKFFHRVSERLSKPNIFILNNRWDCSAQEEAEMMEEVRKQHFDANIKFLSHELEVVDEATAKDRIFFVSAKEVLQVRTQTQPGTVDEEEGRGLDNGWKLRLMEFEKFEELFKECISSSAILTKFEQHYKRGSEVIVELEQVLGREGNEISSQLQLMEDKFKETNARRDLIKTEGPRIHQDCKNALAETANVVEKKLGIAIEKMQSDLHKMAKQFDGNFKEAPLPSFQMSLCEFMDEKLNQKLATVSLYEEHKKTKHQIVEEYSQVLLGGADLHHSYNMFQAPPLSFTFKCSELCKDVQVDSNFIFSRSLGLGNWTRNMVRLEPYMGRLYRTVANVGTFLPMEYVVPIGLLGGALMLPRVFSWRVWATSGVVLGALYAWKWSTFEPEAAVKSQIVDCISSKLGEQKLATTRNHRDQLMNGLGSVLTGLEGKLREEEGNINTSTSDIIKEKEQLNYFQNQAKELKNATHFLMRDFEKYKQIHLDKATTK